MSELMARLDAVPDSVSFAITILLVLALCALSNRRNPASRGPDAEKASGVRPGASPTHGAVVSGPPSIRLEQAPACDRASDLLSDTNNTVSGLSGRVAVGSTVAGAPTVLYTWRRPGWELEKVDDEYGGWLIRKEERWP